MALKLASARQAARPLGRSIPVELAALADAVRQILSGHVKRGCVLMVDATVFSCL
jgi:hypothetical protein